MDILCTMHTILGNLLIYCLYNAVAQWLRCCTTNRKFAGSIPDGVTGIFY